MPVDPLVTEWTDTTGKVRRVETHKLNTQTVEEWEAQHAAEVAAAKERWPEAP